MHLKFWLDRLGYTSVGPTTLLVSDIKCVKPVHVKCN